MGDHGRSLGYLVSCYRKRRLNANGAHWSQEELAFAVGTDQANISRIESNRSHPQFSTLVRICEALNLSTGERDELLSLAGYQLAPSLPDESAVAWITEKLAPLLDGFPYPVMLLDESERIWYWNAFSLCIWGPCYGAATRAEFQSRVRGKRMLEVFFESHHYASHESPWARCENLDRIVRRNLALLWRAHRVRRQDPEMDRALRRLKANAHFARLWDEVVRSPEEGIFVEHSAQTIRTPEFGELRFLIWRTHAAPDERFIVVHLTPADAATIHALRRIAVANSIEAECEQGS